MQAQPQVGAAQEPRVVLVREPRGAHGDTAEPPFLLEGGDALEVVRLPGPLTGDDGEQVGEIGPARGLARVRDQRGEEQAEVLVRGPGRAAHEQARRALRERRGVGFDGGDLVQGGGARGGGGDGLEGRGWAVVEDEGGGVGAGDVPGEEAGHGGGDGEVDGGCAGEAELDGAGEADEGVGVTVGEAEGEDGEAEVVPVDHEAGGAEAGDGQGDGEDGDGGRILDEDVRRGWGGVGEGVVEVEGLEDCLEGPEDWEEHRGTVGEE